MLSISAKILSGVIVSDAMNAVAMIREMVEAQRGDGIARAIDSVARRTRLSARRVRTFWQGNLADWWASEDRAIRTAYGNWIEAHCRQMDAEQAILRARLDALKERHDLPQD